MTSAPSPETSSTYLNSGQQPPPATPAPPMVRPPLRRSLTDRMVAGVCGGLAEHTGIDSLVWRVGFVALAFAGGSGILIYLLLWVLMPPGQRAADQEPGRIDRLAEQAHDKIYATGWIPPRT